MAIELPEAVVRLLSVIGINFPEVNEDHVRELGSHVRVFAESVSQTHQDATNTITQMGHSYQGASYDALVQRWGEMSSQHMTALQDACRAATTAMDVAADFIVAQKVAAIAELAVMAAAFVADQAAAAVTFGLSEAALPLIEIGARKLCEALEQQLTQYVVGEVVGAAIKPLVDVVEKAVSGFAFQAGGSGTAAGGSVGRSLMMEPGQLTAQARAMLDHADTMQQHAETFSSNVSALTFT